MDPLYLTQVTFACLLTLCSCLGNIAAGIAMKLSIVPTCPYFINLMLLELLAILCGPVAYLVAEFFNPWWLRKGMSICLGVEVFQSYSITGSLFALTFLAWSHGHRRELPQKKSVLAFSILSTWFLPVVLILCTFLIQKSHLLTIPWFMSCGSSAARPREFPLLTTIIVAIAIPVHCFSFWLAFSSIMSKNTYHVLDYWRRHKREIAINDPECSTYHMSCSESTSVSLDKVFSVLPGKKSSTGQISVYNANWSFANLNPQQDIPKTQENSEKTENTKTDLNDVFFENNKNEASKVFVESGAGKQKHNTDLDSVFTDPADPVASLTTDEQLFTSTSSANTLKSPSSVEERSSRTSVEHAVHSARNAAPNNHAEDTTNTTVTTAAAPYSSKNSTNSLTRHNQATVDIPSENLSSRVKHPATSHSPTRNALSHSPTRDHVSTSLSSAGHTPATQSMTGSYALFNYSPALNLSPWYYKPSPSISSYPYPASLGFHDLRKNKRALFISPSTLDFAKTDLAVYEFKKIVLTISCLSLIVWLLFSIVFILRIAEVTLPEELLQLSVLVVFIKSAMTPIFYGFCFSRHRKSCKKFITSWLPLKLITSEKKCSFNLNDAAFTGAYLAQDECIVQLTKLSTTLNSSLIG